MSFSISEKNKFGLYVALIILILLYLPNLASFISKSQQSAHGINMCRVTNKVDLEVALGEKEKYTNIPDYDADVFISFSKNRYQENDEIGINLKIENTGINSLSKPYFYLLLFNPSDKLEALYPCANEKETQFILKNYGKYTHNPRPNWEPWSNPYLDRKSVV